MDINEIKKSFEKNKRFKDLTIRTADEVAHVDVLPTGIEELDTVVLGMGGLPRGKITVFWGPYECGKSTFAGAIIGNMQRNNLGIYGNTAVMLDAEGKFYPKWWEEWGVDTSKLIIPEFRYGEEAFDIAMSMFGKVDIIVLDSLAALSSIESATREDDKQRYAPESRMIARKLRDVKNGMYEKNKTTGSVSGLVTPKLSDTGTVLIIINQVRDNIGVMYGKKFKMPGGKTIEHLVSIWLRMDIVQYAKERDEYGGITKQKMRIKCDRNHYAPPQRECEVWVNLPERKFEVSSASYILNMGIDKGILEKRKAWIIGKDLPDGKIQGLKKLLDFLSTDEGKDLRVKIVGEVELPDEPESEGSSFEMDEEEPNPEIENKSGIIGK